MKKYLLQIIGLCVSLISYVYFIPWIDIGIFLDKTEYDQFYLDVLRPPFMVINGIFIALFALSFFFKKQTKWLFVLFIISFLIMFCINHYYWSVLNHGQGA